MNLKKYSEAIEEFRKKLRFGIKNLLYKITIKEIEASPIRYLGKKVNLKGISKRFVTVGPFSGFNFYQEKDFIPVKTKTTIEEGKKVKISGKVRKINVIGLYINAESVKILK